MKVMSMSDKELLTVLLGRRGAAGYTGQLRPIFQEALEAGDPRLLPLVVARELVERWLREELETGALVSSPESVRTYLLSWFNGQGYESFVTLFLDAQNRVIVVEELFRGTLTQTAVYPREVVRRALALNAAAVVFAHNHPSGIAEPSRADEFLTSSLKTALALVDVRVLDHFVVGGASATSFAERGLL